MEKMKLIETNMNAALKKPALNEATGSQEGWSVQIWHLGERNLNGRTYTKELAERLVAENTKTLCMDGHENYMSEYANAMAYAFDPYIENGYMCVHFEFIDKQYEEKILFCLEHEIPVGVSSVGYGTQDEKGIITPEDYELVRYFDFVSTPANETFVAKPESTPNPEKEKANAPEATAESVNESSTEDEQKLNLARLALLMHKSNIKK